MIVRYSILSLLVVLINFRILSSQEVQAEYLDFEWNETPEFEKPEDADHSVIGIMNKISTEFIFENKSFLQYEFNHDVRYINQEAGIEESNRIYVPLRSEVEVVYQKVRVINSEGKITVLDESNIQEGENEENGYTYRYYAVEGLEVGSFVETLLLLRGPAKYTGVKQEIQTYYPQFNVTFEIISPELMYFSFNSLNGLPDVESDTLIEDKNQWVLQLDTLEEFKDEPVSYYDANLKSVVYKLSDNLYSGSRDLSSYGSAANSYYKFLYLNTEKSDQKAVSQLLKDIGISKKMPYEDQVRLFENYVKETFAILPYVDESQEGIKPLIANKAGDERSVQKLYSTALDLMEIEHEVILTSNRTYLRFDQKYEAMNYLRNVLFYLKDQDLYLSPSAVTLRLGYVPWQNTANYGLYIKPLSIGGIVSGIGKIKMIPALPYDKSQYNHRIKADLSEDPTYPSIEFVNELTGYHATPLQTSYKYLSDDVKTKLMVDLKESFTSEEIDSEVEIENAEPELFGKKPLIIKLSGDFPEFTEDAGGKIIFKIGELIGEQSEMYHEDERQHDVENDFNRAYYRTIEVILPEGYNVDNLEKLNMDVKSEDGSAIFVSTYELKDGMLRVDVEEYYNKIRYPLEEFEEYRKVVNAAADFNKIVLVLSKSN